MKKLTAIVAAFLLTIGVAHAGWQAGGDVTVNNSRIKWRVYNSTPYVMYCNGMLYGQTQYGQTGSEQLSVQIGPGQWATRYLATWGNAYFVYGWANVNCQI